LWVRNIVMDATIDFPFNFNIADYGNKTPWAPDILHIGVTRKCYAKHLNYCAILRIQDDIIFASFLCLPPFWGR
jgi:hypothetical protein